MRTALIAAAAAAVLLAAVQCLLGTDFLTGTADRYCREYVDADVRIGKISASVLKNFPHLHIEAEDVAVTYPHDRYSVYDSVGVRGALRGAGRAAGADTLASFRRMSLTVSWLHALAGKLNIREISLDRPRMFAHGYGDGAANWNILRFSEDRAADADTSISVMPPVTLRRISLTGRPHIVYTDIADTLYAAVLLKDLLFDGRFTTDNTSRNRLNVTADSIFISGRLPADTLAVAISRIGVRDRGGDMHLETEAKVFLGMNRYGRLILPVTVEGVLAFPRAEVPEVAVRSLCADIAALRLTGEGEAKFYGDSTRLRADMSVDSCSVEEMIRSFGKNFLPAAAALRTDAAVTLTASCDGFYNPSCGTLPVIDSRLVIPRARLRYPGIPDGSVEASVSACTDSSGHLDVAVDQICLILGGVDVDISGTVCDVTGEDPLVEMDCRASASLQDLMAFVPDSLGYSAEGLLEAALKGGIRLSQMTPYNFCDAPLDGYVRCSDLSVSSERDGLDIWLRSPHLDITSVSSRRAGVRRTSAKSLTAVLSVDSLAARCGSGLSVRACGSVLSVANSSEASSGAACGQKMIRPVLGSLEAGRLVLKGSDSLLVGADSSSVRLRYEENPYDGAKVPALYLSGDCKRAFARLDDGRYGLRSVSVSASASLATVERRRRRRMFLDSLSREYPGVPRDSLFGTMIRARMQGRPVPDFIAEEDFRKRDIRISLGETAEKYLREWNVQGSAGIGGGFAITPYFPVRNRFEDVHCSLSNDHIGVESLTFLPGSSCLKANGELTGLRRAIRGGGPMKLDLRLSADRIDAGELMSAYSAGARYAPEKSAASAALSDEDDEAYLSRISSEAADSSYSLLVVPANLIADISLKARQVQWSDLCIDSLSADVSMRERCVQVTNTVASSNMGGISFDGYYSTRTKNDIKAGFDLKMSDITADKVVRLFPAVDSILPMLTSFKGMLDCEMAATSDLDTNMNFITSSMTGMMRIRGRDVGLSGSPAFRSLARTLMFKNRNGGVVGDMSVCGLIGGDKLEIFPFVLGIDRYRLAMSGRQNFDGNFKYHVSVLKSPIPFRFGIDLSGNFDKWRYRLCKARYKTADVPVFTTLIDTMRVNLVHSIRDIFAKGADMAAARNSAVRDSIDARKYDMGYAPDVAGEPLDAEQKMELDSLRSGDETQPGDVLPALRPVLPPSSGPPAGGVLSASRTSLPQASPSESASGSRAADKCSRNSKEK